MRRDFIFICAYVSENQKGHVRVCYNWIYTRILYIFSFLLFEQTLFLFPQIVLLIGWLSPILMKNVETANFKTLSLSLFFQKKKNSATKCPLITD